MKEVPGTLIDCQWQGFSQSYEYTRSADCNLLIQRLLCSVQVWYCQVQYCTVLHKRTALCRSVFGLYLQEVMHLHYFAGLYWQVLVLHILCRSECLVLAGIALTPLCRSACVALAGIAFTVLCRSVYGIGRFCTYVLCRSLFGWYWQVLHILCRSVFE